MIRLGLDRIGQYEPLFRGKRIGLITNYSGVSSDLVDNITCFVNAGFLIFKIYTPEHGLFGAMDGAKVEDRLQPVYQIPIISLYGEKVIPSVEDFQGIDLLVYDIQDVGLRYYTYIYTLANCMKTADEAGLPLVVLDRPNPLGDSLFGNRMDPSFDCFVGAHRLLTRYGLTCGEIGHYFKNELGLKLEYQVVPMDGYRKSMTFPETGQLWNLPSPSIHTFQSLLCYVGGCFFEATNVSEGRGTAEPFQIFGAPYIQMQKLVKELKNRIHEPKVAFRERAFTPFWSKYAGETCYGVEFIPLSPELNFFEPALKTLRLIREMYPNDFAFKSYADVSRLPSLSGDEKTGDYVEGRITFEDLMESWEKDAKSFKKDIEPLRIYE